MNQPSVHIPTRSRTGTSRALTVLATAALLVGASGLSLAQGLPDGHGVPTSSGSKLTSSLSNPADADDYVFAGYPGAKIKASVKVAKGAGLEPVLELLRPDGTLVTAADGAKIKTKSTSAKVTFTADAIGTWKVRVRRGGGADVGEYTLTVKYGKPKLAKLKNVAPQDDEFDFPVPAVGGARVTLSFGHVGGDPRFVALRAPDGSDLPGTQASIKSSGKKLQLKKYVIPAGLPQGEYRFVVSENPVVPTRKVSFAAVVKLPPGEKKRKARLSPDEPAIPADPGVQPPLGGAGTRVTVATLFPVDENDPEGLPRAFIGPVELENVLLNGATSPFQVSGDVPSGLTIGETYDVVVRTSTGQEAVAEDAFTAVLPPRVTSMDPTTGTNRGGFEATISGADFRGGADIRITLNGTQVPVAILSASDTQVTFIAPERGVGPVTFGVRDNVTQLGAELPPGSFEYLFTPLVERVSPSLTPVLGGDSIFVGGFQFEAADELFLERADGSFETLTGTFVNADLHQFTAPVRPAGSYEVFVRDSDGVRSPGLFELTYFTFADGTALTGLGNPPAGDLRDAFSTEVADYDGDGDDDLILARRGGLDPSTTPETRIFENDGTGALTDVTATVMPVATPDDDWRAHRARVEDVTQDGFPDLILATDEFRLFENDRSHLRILVSRRRAGGAETDREFVDETDALMAPVRMKMRGFGGGGLVADNWRGSDLWVGDLDLDTDEPPEMVIVTDQTFEEAAYPGQQGWACDPPGPGDYCTLGPTTAHYAFYWGGARMFEWDDARRGGLGQFRFEHNFFPRASGVTVPQAMIGIACNLTTPCVGTFTPFRGDRLAVGFLDLDDKPDFAVLSSNVVERDSGTISSLQVALNVFDSDAGSLVTDVTSAFTDIGGDTQGDAVAIGRLGYPDNTPYGTIVIAKRDAGPGTGAVMRVFQFGEQASTSTLEVEDISSDVLPDVSALADKLQASALAFRDIDGDGDQDLVAVAHEDPGGGGAAFRILRNVVVGQQTGLLRRSLDTLIDDLATAQDALEGDSLAIGDLDGDALIDYVVTRETSVGDDSQTRVIRTIAE